MEDGSFRANFKVEVGWASPTSLRRRSLCTVGDAHPTNYEPGLKCRYV